MPKVIDAMPQISVRLYKTVARKTVDGQAAVSARYKGADQFIDLTPFLNRGSVVTTTKSVRAPAGAFSISFADRPQESTWAERQPFLCAPDFALESVYGLVEPMDMIEIRMWRGTGPAPAVLPIKMRGFVSEVQRSMSMGSNGAPVRQVLVTGHDFGKIWQMYQVLFLPSYAGGQPLLTTWALMEMFSLSAQNATPAGEFVRQMVQKVVNEHIRGFIPKDSPIPKEMREILTGDSISVKSGVVSLASQQAQGSIYDILKLHGDVGPWNELYTEDREDGVHAVYRPIPALHIARRKDGKRVKIQEDAPDPVFVPVPDSEVQSLSVSRTDANVANFYWVDSSRFDLITEVYRKQFGLGQDDSTVNIKDYPNAAASLYGVRPMYASSMQGDDETPNLTTGQPEPAHEARNTRSADWIEKRRRILMEMNKDNVVLERGTARIKGGPMRADGKECMKAGDYAEFEMGRMKFVAYVVQITDEYRAFEGYTTSLSFERGEGFVERATMEGGAESPWLAEQASR